MQSKVRMGTASSSHHPILMSLESLNKMLDEIAREADIKTYNVLSAYIPGNLQKTAENVESILQDYLQEYKRHLIQKSIR